MVISEGVYAICSRATHVVNEVSRISAKCEELIPCIRGEIAVDCLQDRHEQRGGDEADPALVEEGKRLYAKAHDVSRGEAQREKARRKCYQAKDIRCKVGRYSGEFTVYLVMLKTSITKLDAPDPVTWQDI